MNEYRIKVTVRNNLLLSAIEAAGYASQTEFAIAAELNVSAVNNVVAMRQPPIGANGEFGHTAKVIMEVLGACPSDLWTDEQLTMRLKRNSGERTMDGNAVAAMIESNVQTMTLPDPSDSAESGELRKIVSDVLQKSLTPRERKVICFRLGIGSPDEEERTLTDVAKQLDVTPERIRQIEARVLRKLRRPLAGC